MQNIKETRRKADRKSAEKKNIDRNINKVKEITSTARNYNAYKILPEERKKNQTKVNRKIQTAKYTNT